MTAPILVRLCLKLDGGLFDLYQVSMMKALVTVAFFGGFRLGELVQKGGSVVVMVDGVEFTDAGMPVTLLRSKPSVVPQVIRVVRALDVRVCPVRLTRGRGVRRIFGGGVPRGGGGVPRSAKEANNPILLKVQSLQLSFRPAGVSLGGGGGGQGPPWPPPAYAPEGVSA